MTRVNKPSPDELARAAANRLQIATGWPGNAVGGRVVIRLTPTQTDWLADLIRDFTRDNRDRDAVHILNDVNNDEGDDAA